MATGRGQQSRCAWNGRAATWSESPAIAGHHGDLHTFRVCCRLARGFALDDDEALARPRRLERAMSAAME